MYFDPKKNFDVKLLHVLKVRDFEEKTSEVETLIKILNQNLITEATQLFQETRFPNVKKVNINKLCLVQGNKL